MPKPFILCADDFAMTPGVSRAIVELLAAGRISATSAMTNRPHWRKLGSDLQPFAGKADLGLHLNLTCGVPLGPMPKLAPSGSLPALSDLMRIAAVPGPARAEIALEIERQLDAFENRLGRAPDFVDGHQHVHVLPGIRGALMAALAKRYPAGSLYLRNSADTPRRILARGGPVRKALVVAGLAAGFARQAKRAALPVNDSFAGFSDFDARTGFASAFAGYLRAPGKVHLVMCHPGFVDDELIALDPVVATRPIEHAFLAGSKFLEVCEAAGMRVGRFGECG